jgi:hypothetical protein
MNKHVPALAFVFAALSTFGCAVEPALRKGAFELEATGGWNELEKPSAAADLSDNGVVGTLAAGYAVNDWLEPGLLVSVSTVSVEQNFDAVAASINADLTTVLVGPFVRFNLPTSSPVVPFAELAGGFASVNFDTTMTVPGGRASDSESENGWFYQAGIGARWFVLEQLAITGVARYQWIDVSDTNKIEQLQFAVGISLVF